MNIHDSAHALARAIKESPEYQQYAELKASASKNDELAAMLNDFQAKQFEIQRKQLMGEELGDDLTQQIQSLYQVLMTDPLAAQYVQAEMRFSLMINDVYTILGEVIQFDK